MVAYADRWASSGAGVNTFPGPSSPSRPKLLPGSFTFSNRVDLLGQHTQRIPMESVDFSNGISLCEYSSRGRGRAPCERFVCMSVGRIVFNQMVRGGQLLHRIFTTKTLAEQNGPGSATFPSDGKSKRCCGCAPIRSHDSGYSKLKATTTGDGICCRIMRATQFRATTAGGCWPSKGTIQFLTHSSLQMSNILEPCFCFHAPFGGALMPAPWPVQW